MATHVQDAYTEPSLLTFPNVRVHIKVERWPTVLTEEGRSDESRGFLSAPTGIEPGIERTELDALQVRNWREIRTNLLNLDVNNSDSVCAWLASAGYVPKAILEKPSYPNGSYPFFTHGDVERMTAGSLGWQPEFVTAGIRQLLEKHRDVFAWLMQLEERQFREAIKAAHEFRTAHYETYQTIASEVLSSRPRVPRLKDPAAEFLEELDTPNLDPWVLGLALRGTSESERLAAYLYWDAEGFPTVTARCNSPLEALCISIHIDQRLSKRRAVQCPCGKWRGQNMQGRDRFCSTRCRNFYETKDRRRKISLVKQAAQEWEALPAHKKTNRDRAEWIVRQVSKGSAGVYDLKPSWVRKMLRSSGSENRKGHAQNKQVPTPKAGTGKARAAKSAERK